MRAIFIRRAPCRGLDPAKIHKLRIAIENAEAFVAEAIHRLDRARRTRKRRWHNGPKNRNTGIFSRKTTRLDLDRFKPKPPKPPTRPGPKDLRGIAEAARSSPAGKASASTPREGPATAARPAPHGRSATVTLRNDARPSNRFYALAAGARLAVGEAFEHAVAALERETGRA